MQTKAPLMRGFCFSANFLRGVRIVRVLFFLFAMYFVGVVRYSIFLPMPQSDFVQNWHSVAHLH
ncbi:MAG: hypothetical protein V4488_17320 [Pseudomonadota bacterium]